MHINALKNLKNHVTDQGAQHTFVMHYIHLQLMKFRIIKELKINFITIIRDAIHTYPVL